MSVMRHCHYWVGCKLDVNVGGCKAHSSPNTHQKESVRTKGLPDSSSHREAFIWSTDSIRHSWNDPKSLHFSLHKSTHETSSALEERKKERNREKVTEEKRNQVQFYQLLLHHRQEKRSQVTTCFTQLYFVSSSTTQVQQSNLTKMTFDRSINQTNHTQHLTLHGKSMTYSHKITRSPICTHCHKLLPHLFSHFSQPFLTRRINWMSTCSVSLHQLLSQCLLSTVVNEITLSLNVEKIA